MVRGLKKLIIFAGAALLFTGAVFAVRSAAVIIKADAAFSVEISRSGASADMTVYGTDNLIKSGSYKNANEYKSIVHYSDADSYFALPQNTLIKDGSYFKGWTVKVKETGKTEVTLTKAGGSTLFKEGEEIKSYLSGVTTSAAVTLVPQFESGAGGTYNVVFYKNDGSTTHSDWKGLYKNATYLLTNRGFSRTGYKFVGWSDKAAPASTDQIYRYLPSKDSSFSGTLTLYAQWAYDNSYNIVFDHNMGEGSRFSEYKGTLTGSMATQILSIDGTGYLTRNAFKSNRVEFIEWNTKPDGTGLSYKDGQVAPKTDIGGTIRLYAQWSNPNKYYLIFNGNGAEGSMKYIELPKSDPTLGSLPANEFTWAEHQFLGWSMNANGSGMIYQDYSTITLTKNTTLYAQWKADQYKISFDGNGGLGKNGSNMPDMVCDSGRSYSISANTYTRMGCRFIGWNTRADGTGMNYADKGSIVITENIVLYAQWTTDVGPYYVKFYGNGATSGSTVSMTCYLDQIYNLTQNGFSRTGYKFAGWGKNKGLSWENVDYGLNAEIFNLGSNQETIKLYAIWKPVNYRIVYKLNGGTNDEDNGKYYTILDSVKLYKPRKSGYKFGGWYTDKNFKNKITRIKAGSVGKITVYAKWIKK